MSNVNQSSQETALLPCSRCGLPTGRIENGVLIIESRHHGRTHRNVYALDQIRRMIEQQADGSPPASETVTDAP